MGEGEPVQQERGIAGNVRIGPLEAFEVTKGEAVLGGEALSKVVAMDGRVAMDIDDRKGSVVDVTA